MALSKDKIYPFLPSTLKKDIEIIYTGLKSKNLTFEDLPDESRFDKKIITLFIPFDPSVVLKIPYDLELILFAISYNGMLIEHFKQLQDNLDIVRMAVIKTPRAIEFASDRLKGNKLIAYEVLTRNGMLVMYFNDEIQMDQDIMLTAINQNINAVKFAHPTLVNSIEFQLIQDKKYFRLTTRNLQIKKLSDLNFYFQ